MGQRTGLSTWPLVPGMAWPSCVTPSLSPRTPILKFRRPRASDPGLCTSHPALCGLSPIPGPAGPLQGTRHAVIRKCVKELQGQIFVSSFNSEDPQTKRR